MKLSDDLLADFSRDGYLSFPGLITAKELEPLRRGVETMSSRPGPEAIFEANRATVLKILFGVDELDEAYRRLRSHPSLLGPCEQLLKTQVYVYQARINFNSGFAGGGWGWHQDFNQWYRQDGLQRPDALLVGMFLDDINACNAPLMVIPGSHKSGHIYIPDRMEIGEDLVTDQVREGGIEPMLGPAGTVVFLHPLTIHGSAQNITPWPRSICYFVYNSVQNTELTHPRGNFRCRTDFTPLSQLDERCLLELADQVDDPEPIPEVGLSGAIPEPSRR